MGQEGEAYEPNEALHVQKLPSDIDCVDIHMQHCLEGKPDDLGLGQPLLVRDELGSAWRDNDNV